jgi:hypothetical protein
LELISKLDVRVACVMPEVQNREADTRNWTLEQWKDM